MTDTEHCILPDIVQPYSLQSLVTSKTVQLQHLSVLLFSKMPLFAALNLYYNKYKYIFK